MDQSTTNAANANLSLYKTTETKSNQLEVLVLLQAQDMRGAREDKLAGINGKLEAEISELKDQLRHARDESDRIQAQHHTNLQRASDMNQTLGRELARKNHVVDTLRLDHMATLKDHNELKARQARLKEQQKVLAGIVREERDPQQSLQSSQRPDSDAQARADRIALQDSRALVARLEEDNERLSHGRKTDEETIRQLSRRVHTYKKHADQITDLEKLLVNFVRGF